jgi:hypothetical protein
VNVPTAAFKTSVSRRCHKSDETRHVHNRTNTYRTGVLPQARPYEAPGNRTHSDTCGRCVPTSQAEYAGSIPVIGSTSTSLAARLGPSTTRSCTGRPGQTQLAERGVGVDGHHPVIVVDLREDRPTQAATVVLPIRVGGVVVTDPDGVSWSCSNCATIFTRTP